MVGLLWTVLKVLLLILGILMVIDIILSLIIEPIQRKKKQEAANTFMEKIAEVAEECLREELAKEENKTTKKPKKTTKKKEN